MISIYSLKLPIGDAGSSEDDQRWRLATGTPDSDPDGLYKERLYDLPSEVGFEVSWLDNPSLGQATFVLLADDLEDHLLRTDHRKIAALTEDVTATATTLTATSEVLAGQTHYLAGEAVTFGVHTGSGVYVGCDRGRFGTVPVPHRVGAAIIGYLHLRRGATAYLYRTTAANGIGGEKLIRPYRVVDIECEDDEVQIQCEDLLQAVFEGEIGRDLWRGVTGNPGTPQDVGITVKSPVESEDGSLLPTPAGGVLGGAQQMLVAVKDVGAFLADWVQTDDGAYEARWSPLSGRPMLSADTDLAEEVPAGVEAWEWVLVGGGIQPASASPATSGSLPFSANPVEFLRQVLTTTEGGGNGAFDIGRRGWGLAVAEAALHIESWDQQAARFAGRLLGQLPLCLDGQPVKVSVLLEKAFRPLGLTLSYLGGRIGVVEWRDAQEYSEAGTLLQKHFHTVPKRINNEQVRFGVVELRTGGELGQAEVPVKVSLSDDLGTDYDGAGVLQLDVSGFGGAEQFAAEEGLTLAERYRMAPPIIENVEVDEADLDADAGTVVEVTHAKIRGVDGELGIEQYPCIVLGRQLDAWGQFLAYVLLMASQAIERTGFISPALKVEGSDGAEDGTSHIAVERRHHQDGTFPALDPDGFGFSAPVKVFVTDQEHTLSISSGLSVDAIFGNQDETGAFSATTDRLVISGLSGKAIGVGDIIHHATYLLASTNVRDDFAFFSNDSEPATVSGDPAYEYTS